jgi:hypothetical protein
MIIFGLVFIKKNNQIDLKKKKPKPNRNRFKQIGFGSVWFFWTKNCSNRFGSVFSGFFGLSSVRFFQFQACKTEIKPNRSVFSKF